MSPRIKQWTIAAAVVALLAGGGWWYWQQQQAGKETEGFASGNGRIEATEVDISAKMPGRVKDILVNEGDLVKSEQVVAHIDASAMQAQLDQAQAQLHKARADLVTAQAVVRQRESERTMARKTLERTQSLLADRAISQQQVDEDRTRVNSMDAALTVARSQVKQAQAGIAASEAGVVRLQSELNDTELRAPRDGRIQYRVVQPGEVVGAGGKVLSMLDLNDVYMGFFLPEQLAGQVGLGSEVRIVLDAAPQFVIPARISYVASVAQFTPKSVETHNERQKLMFRVKARIDPALLQNYQQSVKSGLPGVAHVRLGAQHEWPQQLQVKLPHVTAAQTAASH